MVLIYLDNFDNKEQGEREGEDDKQQRAQRYRLGEYAGAFFASCKYINRIIADKYFSFFWILPTASDGFGFVADPFFSSIFVTL